VTVELPRDDHVELQRHTYGMKPPNMIPDPRARREVVATIVAHSDRGDGYCDVCKVPDPCRARLWHEGVLARMRR